MFSVRGVFRSVGSHGGRLRRGEVLNSMLEFCQGVGRQQRRSYTLQLPATDTGDEVYKEGPYQKGIFMEPGPFAEEVAMIEGRLLGGQKVSEAYQVAIREAYLRPDGHQVDPLGEIDLSKRDQAIEYVMEPLEKGGVAESCIFRTHPEFFEGGAYEHSFIGNMRWHTPKCFSDRNLEFAEKLASEIDGSKPATFSLETHIYLGNMPPLSRRELEVVYPEFSRLSMVEYAGAIEAKILKDQGPTIADGMKIVTIHEPKKTKTPDTITDVFVKFKGIASPHATASIQCYLKNGKQVSFGLEGGRPGILVVGDSGSGLVPYTAKHAQLYDFIVCQNTKQSRDLDALKADLRSEEEIRREVVAKLEKDTPDLAKDVATIERLVGAQIIENVNAEDYFTYLDPEDLTGVKADPRTQQAVINYHKDVSDSGRQVFTSDGIPFLSVTVDCPNVVEAVSVMAYATGALRQHALTFGPYYASGAKSFEDVNCLPCALFVGLSGGISPDTLVGMFQQGPLYDLSESMRSPAYEEVLRVGLEMTSDEAQMGTAKGKVYSLITSASVMRNFLGSHAYLRYAQSIIEKTEQAKAASFEAEIHQKLKLGVIDLQGRSKDRWAIDLASIVFLFKAFGPDIFSKELTFFERANIDELVQKHELGVGREGDRAKAAMLELATRADKLLGRQNPRDVIDVVRLSLVEKIDQLSKDILSIEKDEGEASPDAYYLTKKNSLMLAQAGLNFIDKDLSVIK
ncbi:MAG: hypothetical protein V7750_13050 [Sneathiella sp.]